MWYPQGLARGKEHCSHSVLLAAGLSRLLLTASAEIRVTALAGILAQHLLWRSPGASVLCFVFQSWAETEILCVFWENLQGMGKEGTVQDLGGCQKKPAGVKTATDCRCEDSQVMKIENHSMRMEGNSFHPGAESKPQHPVHDPGRLREAPWGSG